MFFKFCINRRRCLVILYAVRAAFYWTNLCLTAPHGTPYHDPVVDDDVTDQPPQFFNDSQYDDIEWDWLEDKDFNPFDSCHTTTIIRFRYRIHEIVSYGTPNTGEVFPQTPVRECFPLPGGDE
ncbi:hypothetical protein HOLleu_11438 [Holothuria leucospilota]|uniref:Uncharacterized protein n=1 Tax=Holothuria leucospilota TaxID=206669 RepID=A0A9Q1CGI8_HOLLE|nr:hypothetical protein HOLleu_11438 [Holothuria leucospilota]